MLTALKSDLLREEEWEFHSLSPWLFDVNILFWSSETRELVQVITESNRYQLRSECFVLPPVTKMEEKCQKKCRKVQMRKENKSSVPCSNTAGNVKKIENVYGPFDAILRSNWNFSVLFRGRIQLRQNLWGGSLYGACTILSPGHFDQTVLMKCSIMLSQELSILKSVMKEYFSVEPGVSSG